MTAADPKWNPAINMIDKLKKYSEYIRHLRLPAIAVGFFCLITTIVIILDSESNFGNRFLIPSFVGVVWAMSIYAFIVTFQSVPEKANNSVSIFGKLKRRLHRGWYWIISVVFLSTTLAAIYFTNSVISIWLSDYAE